MITRRLGRTGLEVSALGLGTYQLTGEFNVPLDDADRIFDVAARRGLSYVDAASAYGAGESEELVGRALARHPRWTPAIGTKIGHLDKSVARWTGDEAYRDAVNLDRVIRHSLWLLRRDAVEVYFIHEHNWPQWGFDYETGDSPVLEVLEGLKRDGVIGAIGIGGWDLGLATKLVSTGRIDVVLAAGGINLLDSPMLDELVPAAKAHDAGVLVGGAFGQNSRFLITPFPEDVAAFRASGDPDQVTMADKLDGIYALARDLGATLTELAVRYVLSIEDIHCHVPGARIAEHLEANIDAAEKGPLPSDALDRIAEIQALGSSPSGYAVARLGDRVRGGKG
jgi:Predicted oxidoreductases (related to aryl-alcohol dehydrogenases)